MKSRTPHSSFTRRQFLQTTALAGAAAPFVLPSGLRGATANARLNHACIGVGGMGLEYLHSASAITGAAP